MTSSSDDSLPLLGRKVALDIREQNKQATKALLMDSSDSSLPSWLEEQNASRQGEAGAVTSQATKKSMILIDSDSDSDDIRQTIKDAEKPVAKSEHDAKPPEAGTTVVLDSPSMQQASQVTVTGTNKTKQATLNTIVNSTSATVVIPDKLPMSKLILELESNDAVAGTTDLSGDSGVIGRMLLRKIAAESGTDECMELDLKGSIYNMTPVQYPGTIMVVNFTGSEAKVEGITDMFIQLREDKRFSNDEYAENLKQWLDDDEDDDDTLMKKGGAAKPMPTKNPVGNKRQVKKKQSGGVRKKPAAAKKTGAGRGRKK